MIYEKGQKIFYVHALDNPFIVEYTVVKDKGDWLDVLGKSGVISEMSKRDANIIPNKYNCHRVFNQFYQARNYMNSPKNWCPRIAFRHVYIGAVASKYLGMVECTIEDFKEAADKLWASKGYEYPTTSLSKDWKLLGENE